MARPKDTASSKTGKRRLAKNSPKLVTQLIEATNQAFLKGDWELFFRGAEMQLRRTIPQLSSVDQVVDISAVTDLLAQLKQAREKPSELTTITVIGPKQITEGSESSFSEATDDLD